MSTKLGEAYVDVDAKLDKYNKNIKKGEQKLKKFSDKTAKASKKMSSSFSSLGAALPLLGFAAMATAMKKVVGLAIEQERVEAQLDATLKSTGFAAGLTAIELKTMASELQNVSTFGDEVILTSTNMLLTFKQIGRDTFPRAQQAILDVSVAMKQDLKSSAIQVGKALNDPKIGLTALSRVGITFSEKNKTLIKSLTDMGDVAGAQAIILKELESQFGGSAAAAADTLGGAITQLSNTWGDNLEAIMGGNDDFKESLQDLNRALQKLKPVFQGLGMVLKGAIAPIIKMLEYSLFVIDAIEGLSGDKKVEDVKDAPPPKLAKPKTLGPTAKAKNDYAEQLADAKDFLKAMNDLDKSDSQKSLDREKELTDKTNNLLKSKLITAEEAEQAITDIKKKGTEERIALGIAEAESYIDGTMEFLGALNEVFALNDEGETERVESKRKRDLGILDEKFEKDSDNIKGTIKNKKKQDKALAKLEKEKADKEKEINEQADKEKNALAVKAFKRQQAMDAVQAGIKTALAIITALTTMGPPASFVFAALAAATGAASIGAILAAKPPALADGGVVTGRTFAEIGEAGSEMVTPLDGARGRKSREMFVDDILSSLSDRQDAASVVNEATVTSEEELTFNVTVNVGNDELHTSITQAISNREILIDEGSLIKR